MTVIGPSDRDAGRMARGTVGLDLAWVTYLTGMVATPELEAATGTALLVARVVGPERVRSVAEVLWRTGALRVDVSGPGER